MKHLIVDVEPPYKILQEEACCVKQGCTDSGISKTTHNNWLNGQKNKLCYRLAAVLGTLGDSMCQHDWGEALGSEKNIALILCGYTDEMSESRQTHVTLHDIDPQALEQLVQYAYTAEIVVGEGNVQVW